MGPYEHRRRSRKANALNSKVIASFAVVKQKSAKRGTVICRVHASPALLFMTPAWLVYRQSTVAETDYCNVRATVVECVSAPDVAVTMTVLVPGGVPVWAAEP